MRSYTDKEFHELPEWAKKEIFKLEGQVSRLESVLRNKIGVYHPEKAFCEMGLGK